jgi:hypothetical protein
MAGAMGPELSPEQVELLREVADCFRAREPVT